MNKKQRLFWTGVLACGLAMAASGCACLKKSSSVCKDNEKKGYATITCQPVDTDVANGQQAKFKVEATGKDLSYQWFFRGATGCGDVVGAGTAGGTTPQLTVGLVNSAKGGFYWCEIESTGLYGAPAKTRTRDAHLGITVPSGTGGTGVQIYPPQQAVLPAPKIGSSSCGPHCDWVNYQNAGAGFDPLNATPPLINGLVKVHLNSATDPALANTTYNVKWFDSSGGSGCAANSGTDQKTFPIDQNKIYCFTVYFISPCPAGGTLVFFDLSFVP